MAKACLYGHHMLAEAGRHLGISYATVSRATKCYEFGELTMLAVRPEPAIHIEFSIPLNLLID